MSNPQVVNRLAFRQAPALGTVLMMDGQRYVVVATRPHRRKDGMPTMLVSWRSHCADCGQPFEVTTCLVAKAVNRRCPAHHAPGRAVTAAARQRARRMFARRTARTSATHRASARALNSGRS